MLRQLLTFLALLTGLAAIGAPVQAAVAGGAGAVLERSDFASSQAAESEKGCEDKKQTQLGNEDKPTPCGKRKVITVYVPTVMFGADRAFE